MMMSSSWVMISIIAFTPSGGDLIDERPEEHHHVVEQPDKLGAQLGHGFSFLKEP